MSYYIPLPPWAPAMSWKEQGDTYVHYVALSKQRIVPRSGRSDPLTCSDNGDMSDRTSIGVMSFFVILPKMPIAVFFARSPLLFGRRRDGSLVPHLALFHIYPWLHRGWRHRVDSIAERPHGERHTSGGRIAKCSSGSNGRGDVSRSADGASADGRGAHDSSAQLSDWQNAIRVREDDDWLDRSMSIMSYCNFSVYILILMFRMSVVGRGEAGWLIGRAIR